MKICENCGKEHSGDYGSGRFCSNYCARSFATSKNREEISRKVSETLSRRYSAQKEQKPKKEITTKKVRKALLNGMELAESLNLEKTPYSEYNVVYRRRQVNGRDSYHFCLYTDGKLEKSETVLVYRFLMAMKLGRKLTDKEVVHHKDGNKDNNDISNLELMDRSSHSKFHIKENTKLKDYVLANGPWNKGLKNCYSQESINKMRKSALERFSK